MEHTNISQNNQNYPSNWKIFKVCQKIKSIFKKWWSIRWYHEVLGNAKCILLYIKMPKQPTWSDTAQYHSEAIKSFPVTEKHEKPLIKILKTWKNKRIISAILRNGTCTLTISQGTKTLYPRWDTSISVWKPERHSDLIQTATIWWTLKDFERN